MKIHNSIPWIHQRGRLSTNWKAAIVLAVAALSGVLRLPAAQTPTQLTLSQFLDLIRSRSAQAQQPAPLSDAKKVFSRLLAVQGREAAARQSLDRISGWSKVVQARFEAQHANALDVEMLRFAEMKAGVELAQFQAVRRAAMQEANRMLGRDSDTALVAITQTMPSSSPPTGETVQTISSRPAVTAETPDISQRPAALDTFQKEVMPQAQALLSKLYQNYLYGGVSLGTLLWQEQEIYKAELSYWSALAEAEGVAASGP
ncbi:MAG: hypothetical protein HY649_03450 [Acidobacteria bacterium]|nr:hypothetical protein [Acidobacteriota bacterium]